MRNFLFCLAVFFASVAFAATSAEKPPEINAYVKAEKPYGTGNVTFAFMNIYDAALWTDARPFSWDKPFALRLLYRRHLTSKGLIDKTLELMQDIHPMPPEKLKGYGVQLSRLWPDVKNGDDITAIYQPGGKTVFYYNGQLKGSIDDPDFGRPFFDIWLSPKTTEPATRQSLLSGTR